MDAIKPANTYTARPSGTALYANDRSVFKVYYVDIIGRANPERFEWDRCGRERESVITHLARVGVEGVGAVAAFPHITKVFRFAPSAETIMHVKGYWTPDFSAVDLRREEDYVEFACYAEAIIAAEEYRFWAQAQSVEAYLQQWVSWAEAPIVEHAKLGRYFGAENS